MFWNRLSTIRTGRKRRVAFGAAAIAGLTIVGGATAANAASTPAPKPDGATTVVSVDGASDLTTVRQGDGPHSVPIKPRIGSGKPSLVEVPGAAPDFDSVQTQQPTPIDGVPQSTDKDGKTTARR